MKKKKNNKKTEQHAQLFMDLFTPVIWVSQALVALKMKVEMEINIFHNLSSDR